MSFIGELLDRHVHLCYGDTCEVHSNASLFAANDKLIDEFDSIILGGIVPYKSNPKIRSLVAEVNEHISLLNKALFQDCSERPEEYRDIAFISYLTGKHQLIKRALAKLNQVINDCRALETTTNHKGE